MSTQLMQVGTEAHRPSTLGLLADEVRMSIVELWRTRVVFIFTFLFPLTWLLLLGALAGNAVIDETTGLRVMQFVSPLALVMGVLYATMPTMAAGLAVAREQGTLKRVRGTPLPPWVYLADRVGAAVVFALGSVATMVVVAALGYDVDIIWRTVPATAVAVIVALGCFTAEGMAIAGVSRSAGIAQAGSIAAAVVLGFMSGLFIVGGDLPEWVDRVAGVFPLKAFGEAIQQQFNPYHPGPGWDLGALALMLAWTVGCAVVAVRTFRWDPSADRTAGGSPAAADITGAPVMALPVDRVPRTLRRPTFWTMIGGQVRHAAAQARRDPGSAFFAVAMPIGLFDLLMVTNSSRADDAVGSGGSTFAVALAAGMCTWGAAVTGFINMPEAVMRARDRGVLKRLRGTPLRPGQYLAGGTISAITTAVVTAALILCVAVVWFDTAVSAVGVLLAGAIVVTGVTTFAMCGIALAATMPSSKAVTAVGLGILLPVAFFSDVFIIGETPSWMSTIGSLLPMKPMANSLAAALDPAGPQLQLGALAVLAAWLLIGTVLATHQFRTWGATEDLRGVSGLYQSAGNTTPAERGTPTSTGARSDTDTVTGAGGQSPPIGARSTSATLGP